MKYLVFVLQLPSLSQYLEKRAPFNGMRGKRGEELEMDMGGRVHKQVNMGGRVHKQAKKTGNGLCNIFSLNISTDLSLARKLTTWRSFQWCSKVCACFNKGT